MWSIIEVAVVAVFVLFALKVIWNAPYDPTKRPVDPDGEKE